VTIQSAEADSPKMMPAVSARKANEIPGETAKRTDSGYLLPSTSGNIEKTTPNMATEPSIVHNSLIFGLRPESMIRTAASKGTSTAIRGFDEKYASISPDVCSVTFI